MKRIIVSLFILSGFLVPAHAQSFRAAVSKVDITPSDSQQLLGYGARKSTGVHDRIYHRVAVMDDGTTRFVLVSSDICLVSPSEYDRVAVLLEQQLGIPPENFWWSVTHTHSAPEVGPPGLAEAFLGERYTHAYDKAYTDATTAKLVDAVADAIDRLEPARLSVGWGHANANINRRARRATGETYLGLNPDLPVDRRIGMLRLDRPDGSPIAIMANYAMHGTVIGGECTLISGDAPGIVADYVERESGATMLFINGAAGNIAPIYSTQPNPFRLPEFEVLLGDRILEANERMPEGSATVVFRTGKTVVETPQREGLNWPEYLADYSGENSVGVKVVKLPVRFLKINSDIVIWSAPLELFCEISNEIRERSPFPYTFYYGYTNGWLGYLMTDAEIPFGGYETTVTPFKPGAGQDLIDAVLSYIEGDLSKP
ncbi:neutral/alkaline non-lysosomal ceramidase N-terminal domain-containing protein [Parapedobacter sp. 10938]|uniref:neutral/alkaline non-lysosomal ceramidase N-terminal domain-containing protein n=1 Tax=Parapedobacter flavus TaxID=3110225 RepID=UPI002DBE876A|nr:neutral/alkaline non-lysosomal ceramidase N-terminal domain-containing protein [Parapedobacter sp. 10938]MEC3879453.1 neutral/alkaline non-lysosomal ceramidase N-terminal domain-containing protein [Parapedobacter sp. 10938]